MIAKLEFRGVAQTASTVLGRSDSEQLQGDTPKRSQRWVVTNEGDVAVTFVVMESPDGTTFSNVAAGTLTVAPCSERVQEVTLLGASTHFRPTAYTSSGEAVVRAALVNQESPSIL